MVEAALVVLAAGAVSAAAWRARALDGGGALAATAVGATVLAFAGVGAAVVLVAFFASSSGLSHLTGRGRRARRDARQVLANGSVAAVAALFHGIHPLADVALLGAVAAAAADTWATEIGVRVGGEPRSILTFRPRPRGSSGAVSAAGTAAALAGAAAVGGLGAILVGGGLETIVAVAAGGFAGALADSLLGASVQAEYRCVACGALPELPRHEGCPTAAERVGGLPGIDNDVVNGVATAVGAVVGIVLRAIA